MITKALKFHTDENKGKKTKLHDFLLECTRVSTHLMSLHFGCFYETTKYDFINNTKDYNHFYGLRSHHYQQIQVQVYTKLMNRYNQALKELDLGNRYLNYLKYFLFDWGKTETYLTEKIQKLRKVKTTKLTQKDLLKHEQNIVFITEVLDYWIKNQEHTQQLIRVKFIQCVRSTHFPVFKKLTLILDSRTAEFKTSTKAKKYKSWFSIYTNTRTGKYQYQKIIHIPIKVSKYHEKELHNKTLNNSYILKFDKIYNRIEIIGTYDTKPLHEYKCPAKPDTTVGVDLGVTNLITMSSGFQLNTKALELEFIKFLKYEKQIKRLESKGVKTGTKYLKEQQKLSNKVQNLINKTLHNDVPEGTSLVVFEDLEFKDKSPNRRLNYLLRRFKLQGTLSKLKLRESDFPFKIEQVNPAYTSQQCHMCGYTDRNNRKNQSEFVCCHCGVASNADLNASINIKERFFDKDCVKLKYRGEIKKYLKDKFESHQVTNSVTSELSSPVCIAVT